MKDYNSEAHEITFTRDGVGYCARCDDWHDLDELMEGQQPESSSAPAGQPPAPRNGFWA